MVSDSRAGLANQSARGARAAGYEFRRRDVGFGDALALTRADESLPEFGALFGHAPGEGSKVKVGVPEERAGGRLFG